MTGFIAYVRVSTAKQGEHGASLSAQREAIERYALAHRLPITAWYEETCTAAKVGRRVFNVILEELEHGKASGLIMHKIDRGARNLRDWAVLGELLDRGIDVRFAHEQMDLRSRSGRLSADIQAVVAADFIRNLREETRKGLYARLRQGLYPLPAPLGYLDCGRGRPKVPDPDRAHLVRRAFVQYASGLYTLRALCTELRRAGLTNRAGTPISINGLSVLLKNPFYVGTIRIRRTNGEYPGIHEPLVSRTCFETVQGVLKSRCPRRRRTGRARHRYSRMLRCGSCSLHLIGEIQKARTYYRCHQCPGTSIREDAIDAGIAVGLAAVSVGSAIELDEVLAFMPDMPASTAFRDQLMQPAALYDRATERERRALLDTVVEAYVIEGKTVRLALHRPFGMLSPGLPAESSIPLQGQPLG